MAKTFKYTDGAITVRDSNGNTLGKLIPTFLLDGEQMFKVQMGQYGGFYNASRTFKQALLFLEEKAIEVATKRINRGIKSTNRIHGSKYKVIKQILL